MQSSDVVDDFEIFRVFGTVRLPQLAKDFLRNTVCNNLFLKGSEKCEKILGQVNEILSNKLTERRASSRDQRKIYVFGRNDGHNNLVRLICNIF